MASYLAAIERVLEYLRPRWGKAKLEKLQRLAGVYRRSPAKRAAALADIRKLVRDEPAAAAMLRAKRPKKKAVRRMKGGGSRRRGVMGARKAARRALPKKKAKARGKKKLKGPAMDPGGLYGVGSIGAGGGGGTGSGYGSGGGVGRTLERAERRDHRGGGSPVVRVPRALSRPIGAPASSDPLSALDGLGEEPRRRIMARAVPRMAGAAAPAPAAAPKPTKQKTRWLQARAIDTARETPAQAFRAGAHHEVEVRVAVPSEDWLVAAGRPEDSFDAQLEPGQVHELSVMFFIPSLGVLQQGHLQLPPTGSSTTLRFGFVAGAAGSMLEAQISVVKDGRVLQNAILSGRVVADPAQAVEADRIRLELQVVVPGFGGIAERSTFHATLLAGNDAEGRVVAGGLTHPTAETEATQLFRTPRLDKAARSIREILERVVADPEALKGGLTSEPSTRLLWELAQYGAQLHEVIGSKILEAVPGGKLERVQLIQGDAETFVPIEFIYDLPVPKNGATLCGNWKNALKGKACSVADHPYDAALGHSGVVCPSGFWSVSKVIERQILGRVGEKELEEKEFGIRAEPGPSRNRLSLQAALFAWSEILDNEVPDSSASLKKSLAKFTQDRVVTVDRWADWANDIDTRQPPLLVLLSHTTEDGPLALEIGRAEGGERSTVAQITERYVKKNKGDAPVVFLLGCDTAVADSELYSFVGRFREQGAAVVVGTITPVLGEHSASVVKGLLEEFAAKDPAGPRSFGQVLLSARRKLLARGELTALCATAYGDTDWLVA